MAATSRTKVPLRREHSGDFATDQAQRQAQQVAVKTNEHVDALAVLNNRVYVASAIDNPLNGSALVFTPLLTANISTLLVRGFLILTFTASGTRPPAAGTAYFKLAVDGVVVKGCYDTAPAGGAFSASMVVQVPVSQGQHIVTATWSTDTNSAHINAVSSPFEHADLLIQEAA